jgi:hypothetical protein
MLSTILPLFVALMKAISIFFGKAYRTLAAGFADSPRPSESN